MTGGARAAASGDGLGDGGAADLVWWGWGSVAVSAVLVLLNGVVAAASGSLAVSAEVVHDVADLLAAVSVVAGLAIATRTTPSFPYGLYKAENVVALVIAALVFITAYEIVRDAVFAPPGPLRTNAWMIALVLLGGAIPLVFGHFEMRAGRAAGSPALIADAREYRVHGFTAMLALAALVSGWTDVRFDRLAALGIVVVVVKTGWELLRDALRVLLDASLDAESLIEVRRIISADPAVRELRWVTGRNAGRYRFIEAGVVLRPTEAAAAHAAIARVERTVRRTLRHVERVLLHLEAASTASLRYAIPIEEDGAVSAHFGRAPRFAVVTARRADGAIEEQRTLANPHAARGEGKGVSVAEWLAEMKIDLVLTREIPKGPGPAHVFGEAGIEVRATSAATLPEAIDMARSLLRIGCATGA